MCPTPFLLLNPKPYSSHCALQILLTPNTSPTLFIVPYRSYSRSNKNPNSIIKRCRSFSPPNISFRPLHALCRSDARLKLCGWTPQVAEPLHKMTRMGGACLAIAHVCFLWLVLVYLSSQAAVRCVVYVVYSACMHHMAITHGRFLWLCIFKSTPIAVCSVPLLANPTSTSFILPGAYKSMILQLSSLILL